MSDSPTNERMIKIDIGDEWVWAETLEGTHDNLPTAKIRNMPFTVFDYSYGDVVTYDEQDRVVGLVERATWAGLAAYHAPEDENGRQQRCINFGILVGLLESVGCKVEGAMSGVVSFAAPLTFTCRMIQRLLDSHTSEHRGLALVAFNGPASPDDERMLEDLKHEKATVEDHSEDALATFLTNNVVRAEKAKGMITLQGYGTGTEAQTAVSDMLCDVLHLCRLNDLSFDDALHMARNHHEDERAGVY